MGDNNSQEASNPVSTPQAEPSETSILTSLFGWELCPAVSETKIASRPNSNLFRTASTPALSFPTSIPSSRSVTPTPGPPQPLIHVAGRRDPPLLHCRLCNRRVGLWAFSPPSVENESTPLDGTGCNSLQLQTTQRQLDILKEHRSYCPYVVKSTVVPSFLVPTPNERIITPSPNGQSTLEGWRAALTVVLRYGMDRRQRIGLVSVLDGQGIDSQSWTEPIDDVKAMVAGVKSRGVSAFCVNVSLLEFNHPTL
jgi:hypothetical protein